MNSTGTLTSQGYNLESGTGCGFNRAGDQQSTDPLLAPLANNGTQPHLFTHSLVVGSPAIDKIPIGVNGCGAGTSTDQRGSGAGRRRQ